MPRHTVIVAAMSLWYSLGWPALAQVGNGYIGIYADPQGVSPCVSVPQGSGATLYLVATLGGPSASGISGAEFRIEVGSPAGWFVSFTPPSGAVALGQALDTDPENANDGSGLNLSFAACQTGGAGRVPLGTIGVFNLSGSPTSLTVKRHSTPSNSSFICPLFVLCDEPVYSKLCLSEGGEGCTLGKMAALASSDPAYFVAGLNGLTPVDPAVRGEPRPMEADGLIVRPTLVAPSGQDAITDGVMKASPATRVQSDTTWAPSLDWDFEGVGNQGWETASNLVDTQLNLWGVGPTDSTQNPVFGEKHAFLQYRNLNGCWLTEEPGYGNRWDFAIKVLYHGHAPWVGFTYRLSCDSGDGLTVEADRGDSCNLRVDYTDPDRRWPWQLREVVAGPIFGTALDPVPLYVSLPDFGNTNQVHAAYIRFSSDESVSDEDSLFNSAIDAALTIDNIQVWGDGAQLYTVNFDGDVLDPDIGTSVFLINSGRSTPYGPWARLYTHITDNDLCTENTTRAWLFSDPLHIASFADMAFGPGGVVVQWALDDMILSPWIPMSQLSGGRPVLSFREFPGNWFDRGRIARSWSIRGRYNNQTCTTRWSDEYAGFRNGPWQALNEFQWVTRVFDMAPLVNSEWEEFQLRLRVADVRALFGDLPPPNPSNPGPGPYIDRVRIGRLPAGPFIDIGPDTRFQAQDAFPTVRNAIGPGEHYSPSTNIWGTCAFSMAQDLGSGTSPNIITGDSIVARVGSYGGVLTKVSFLYRIMEGPHMGKKALDGAMEHPGGLCEYVLAENPAGLGGPRTYAMDFDDDYFRGGDVLEYFWYAVGRTSNDPTPLYASYPSGINQQIANLTALQAERLTGGLLEVSFLPSIRWAESYMLRVQAHPTGKVDPIATEIATSEGPYRFVLYVNKANLDRRAVRTHECGPDQCLGHWRVRTSLMYSLDHALAPDGFTGNVPYDVYDLQGFGNTNNDLGSRATVIQAKQVYALIIHDAGAGTYATLPDGSERAAEKVNQVQWYEDYLDSAWQGRHGRGALWVVGDNWAYEARMSENANPSNDLLTAKMGIGVVTPIGSATNFTVKGKTLFTFLPRCPEPPIGTTINFTDRAFVLERECPNHHRYDGLGLAPVTNALQTHGYYTAGSVEPVPAAVVMNQGVSTTEKWTTIGMGFAWSALFNGPSDEEPRRLVYDLIAATRCCGCEPTWGPWPSASDDSLSATTVRETVLRQNTPNPFNGGTSIAFDLASEGPVSVAVFDIAGRLVKTLAHGGFPRGHHVVEWDGASNSGHPVASGVYFYRLGAGTFRATRKLLVMR